VVTICTVFFYGDGGVKIAVLSNVTMCNLVEVHRRLGETCCLRNVGKRVQDCEASLNIRQQCSFFFLHIGGWSRNWVHSARRPLTGLLHLPRVIWGWRSWWNEWQGKPKYSEKTCSDATLSTTNLTWPDPGLNPGRRGGKPATNRFSYGAAISNTHSERCEKFSSQKEPWVLFGLLWTLLWTIKCWEILE
jgi:hypothetical protein